jgi:hypothetical protein
MRLDVLETLVIMEQRDGWDIRQVVYVRQQRKRKRAVVVDALQRKNGWTLPCYLRSLAMPGWELIPYRGQLTALRSRVDSAGQNGFLKEVGYEHMIARHHGHVGALGVTLFVDFSEERGSVNYEGP